jgi:uncharacterized membrane protein YhdT
MNNLATSVALATTPANFFTELRERPKFWFPLLLLVATTGAVAFWYYSLVDFEWLKEQMYGSNPDVLALPEAQRAQVLAMFTRNALQASALIGALFFIPIIFLLQALYLRVAAKVTRVPIGFGHWFAFSCWTALPMLLTTVVSVILILMSDTSQMSPSVLQPLSLNELVYHRPMGSPGYQLLESLSISEFVSWILMILGVKAWSQRSWAFSVTFILLPVVVAYGTWAAVAFR